MLKNGDVLYEGNPYVSRILQTDTRVETAQCISVFISPLSKEEILFFKDPAHKISLPELIEEIMYHKLLHRAKINNDHLSGSDLKDIEIRSKAAYREIKLAHHFDYVLPNHAGEESENWDRFTYPIGDPRKAVLGFNALIEGEESPYCEVWEQDLIP